MPDDGPQGSVCATNEVSALLEQLQFEFGEGPCVDARQREHPVLEPDLNTPAVPRWLAFTGPALAAGVRAVFSFPLLVEGICLGALCLYADRPGLLTDDQYADALLIADLAAEAVLMMQADAEPGRLAAGLVADGDFHDGVYQASGIMAVMLQVSVDQALLRLRAYAFGNDRRLADVVDDVIARTLRFDEETGQADTAA